jgi:hypothetical protein
MFYPLIILSLVAAISAVENEYVAALIILNNKTKREKEEKRVICDYIVTLHRIEPNTCAKNPFDDYRNIYQNSYARELWVYQQKECVPKKNITTTIVMFIIIVVMIINCLFGGP